MNDVPLFPADVSEADRTRWVNILANISLLDNASSETVHSIIGKARFRRINPGDLVFDAREPAAFVFFLLDGIARVFQDGRGGLQYTPKLLRAPGHMGELSSLAGLKEYRSSVEAMTMLVVAQVPMHTIEQRLAADHELCRAWLYSVARQHSVTIDYLKQNIFGSLASRLINVLLSYGEVFGHEDNGMVEIHHSLSYSELAKQAACTRRGAIKAMQALVDQQLVKRVNEGWSVDPRRLLEQLLPGRMSLTHSLDEVKKVPED